MLGRGQGAWNFAGDLWCGTGEEGSAVVGVPPGGRKMSLVEERSTYALFVIMAAPPMLGCVRPRPRADP